jgi:fermentation-respiration switch protein FrsA (DUF1100 family)
MMTIFVAVLIGGLVLKTLVNAAEPKLVFFPTRGEAETPANVGIPYTAVRLRTADGEQLMAWQLEPEQPIADVVYFHGNGGNLSIWLPVLATLHQLQLRVLAVDYRGYGLSSGTPSEAGLYRDAEAVVAHAVAQRAAGARPLIYWGRSLGGPVAASATHVASPDALILESTFPDKAAVVRSNPLLRALNVFGRYRFATAEMLRDFTKPVLVLHAGNDTIIPFALGRELYDRLSPPKRFVAIDEGDHNDLFISTRDAYWRPILDFVATLSRRD